MAIARDKTMRIIALAPNDWHGPWMNRQYLLSRLGRTHSVLYSTGQWRTWDRSTTDFCVAPLLGRFEETDDVVVDHPGRLLLRVPRLPLLDAISRRMAARRWTGRLRLYADEPLWLWIFHPSLAPYADSVPHDYLVYHAYDLYSSTPGWHAADDAAEAAMVRRADLIIASSTAIADHLRSVGGREVCFVPNGVDFDRFSVAAEMAAPADIASIPHPRVGYVGSINPKVDFDLLIELTSRRRDWNWVIVGREVALEGTSHEKWRQLQSQPNVYALGNKSAVDVAGYTAALDVGLLCYRVDGTWAKGIYPIRLHEHLAAGLPIVSADVPAVREFPEVVFVASSADQWEAAIESALAGRGPGTRELRQQTARANTWDCRVNQLERLIAGIAGTPVKTRALNSR